MSARHIQSSKKLYLQIVNDLISLYGEEEARQLTKMLLEETGGLSFEKILIDEPIELNVDAEEKLIEQVKMLKQYHPIQYVLGKAHFFGREFMVDENVLIPRQETEELVKEILVDNIRSGLNILDIGGGSGCIGITLGLELDRANVTLLDVDAGTMKVAAENAKLYGLKVSHIVDDVLTMTQLQDKYDIIVSNPPYVTEGEKSKMLNNVLEHEPARALFVPDHDPLLFYRKIIPLAKEYLLKDGKLYFEINEKYGEEMINLCEQVGCSNVRLIRDLNGKERILKAMFA